jgi:UPF0271 protein
MIELNADIGEGYDDAALMRYVSRVSIACGGHAGDADSMAAALGLAMEFGVLVGAHPSYPDRAGFGRRKIEATPDQVAAWVREQTEVLAEQAARLGMRLAHVKPHGALYNVAAADAEVAAAVARGVAAVDPSLELIGLSASRLIAEARGLGLGVLNEAFIDRRYDAQGRLVSRETPGAVLGDPQLAADQALTLAQGRPLGTADGGSLQVAADTLCLHGDTPHALQIARAVHAVLYRG